MTGLTVILAAADPARFRTACNLAAVQAALGGRVRLFLDAAAVPLLADPLPAEADAAAELGCVMIACQTGLTEAGLDAAAVPSVQTGGMTMLLASLDADRLVVV